MARPVEIAFAQPYPDGRSEKIARGLSRLGLGVHRFLVDFDATYRVTFSVGTFDRVIRLPEMIRQHYYLGAATGVLPRAIRKTIAQLPGDVIRTCTPDLFGAAALGTGRPVVAEVYDMWSLYDQAKGTTIGGRVRRYVQGKAERSVHERADLVIYTTEEMLARAKEKYSLRESLVVPNAVLAEDVPKTPWSKLSEDGRSHCVYVGLVQPSRGSFSRSIAPLLRDLAKEHVIHVYGVVERVNEEAVRSELKDTVQWHDPVPQSRLLQELTQYDFGLILLPNVDVERFHTVLPNKLFEYLCAGIPVLVSPYRAMTNFVRNYQCGTVYGEGLPQGRVPLRPEFLLDTYLPRYVDAIRRIAG
jgi:glycosyltransferase involved in cell wall biosynthesis